MKRPSRLGVVLFVTILEAPAVYAWLALDHHGHATAGFLLLVLGLTAESWSLPAIMLAGPADPSRLSDPRVRAHLRRVTAWAFLAIPAEFVVWLSWRWMVDVVVLAAASVVLFVLMHLKHQLETAAVMGSRYAKGIFSVSGLVASACESAGAVGCLALLRHGEPWLAAVALAAGILVEHWILIGALQREARRRDLCLPPMGSLEARTAPRSSVWRRQGVSNTVELWAGTHLRAVWALAGHDRSPLRSPANRLIINRFAYRMRPRPDPLTTLAPYTSWTSLTDRRYSARHLPPVTGLLAPPVERVVDLFRIGEEGPRLSDRSTLLFGHFAQWFVDGFLHTNPGDPRRNTSTHDIDLSQLYGQTPEVTAMLRGPGGLLKSEPIDDLEYPPRYFGADGRVKPEFEQLALTYPGSDRKLVAPGQPGDLTELDEHRRRGLFALGLPRGNLHYGMVMLSTVFLREHNRLARELRGRYPRWDDDEVFETARNTMTVMLLKIVIADYINHISPLRFRVFWELGLGARERWYRENWMSIEFDLLYRWHALVPAEVDVHGCRRRMDDLLWDAGIVTERGVAVLFDEASRQPSGRVGLFNTPDFLLAAERSAIEIGRRTELAGFNDYREACGYPRLSSFNDISARPEVCEALAQRYARVDDVELFVGLFAEDVVDGGALPTLMGTMVGADAFTQALTNPLLSETVFCEATFSEVGMAEIDRTNTLQDLVTRNVGDEELTAPRVSFS